VRLRAQARASGGFCFGRIPIRFSAFHQFAWQQVKGSGIEGQCRFCNKPAPLLAKPSFWCSAASVAALSLAIAEFWHNWFSRFIADVYFERVALVFPERLPAAGPVLYLGLHRNGAVDGFVYQRVLPNAVFMISTQLRKNFLARLFFHGIAVTRTKDDGDRSLNEAAMRQCITLLEQGGELLVLPEGTSTLGPRHLPFKNGAVWLLLEYLAGGGPRPRVVPLGIHYESPTDFRGRVEVVVGHEISTDLPPESSQLDRLKMMKRRVQTALEEVGVNVESAARQEMIESMALAAALRSGRSYFKLLKTLETAVPANLEHEWKSLEAALGASKAYLTHGLPLFPAPPALFFALAGCFIIPVVCAAALLNLPPLLAGWWAGRTFPDGRNVISLWKILAGIPCFLIWAALVVLAGAWLGKWLWPVAYLVVTWAGLKSYVLFRQIAAFLALGPFQWTRRGPMASFLENLLRSLPDETA
jgi:1-acyl-sn-glycerol-3-phosphate acyltransferase